MPEGPRVPMEPAGKPRMPAVSWRSCWKKYIETKEQQNTQVKQFKHVKKIAYHDNLDGFLRHKWGHCGDHVKR